MDFRALLTSKTIWGLLIAVLAPILAKHGISIDGGVADQLVQLAGVALAIYGRLTAKGPIVNSGSQGPDVASHS